MTQHSIGPERDRDAQIRLAPQGQALLQKALRVAELYGVPVAPGKPDKAPATGSGGVHNASTDPTTINSLFNDAPNAAFVGAHPGPAYMAVIDVDVKCTECKLRKDGTWSCYDHLDAEDIAAQLVVEADDTQSSAAEQQSSLEAELEERFGLHSTRLNPNPKHCTKTKTTHGRHGFEELSSAELRLGRLPDTLNYSTPSGGRHYWFKTTSQRLGQHSPFESIDIRGQGGFVILYGPDVPDLSRAAELPETWLDEVLRAGSVTWDTEVTDEAISAVGREAYDFLLEQGGHHPVVRNHAKGSAFGFTVELQRPGKQGGTGASIGYRDQDKIQFWSSDWPASNGENFPTDMRDVAEWRKWVEGDEDPHRAFAPVMGEAAFYGPLGEAARLFGHTEADPAAILIGLIAGYGGLLGNSVWCAPVDMARQYTRINVAIVGATAKARKSSAWKMAEKVLEKVDSQFFEEDRILGGFGSGQYLVRTIMRLVGVESTKVADYKPQLKKDPRIILFEEEFVRILKTANYEGSIYSSILRQAYDGGKLESRSGNSSDQVVPKGMYHLPVIGCITGEELGGSLTGSERFSGFGNRFIYGWARRTKRVAFTDETIDEDALAQVVETLREHQEAVQGYGEMKLATMEDKLYWKQMYDQIEDDDPPGELGAMIARGADHTIRMALIYAIADGSQVISRKHLDAAHAVWQYCRETAAHVFDRRQLVKSSGNASKDNCKARLIDLIIKNPGKPKSFFHDQPNWAKHGGRNALLKELEGDGLIYFKNGYHAKEANNDQGRQATSEQL